MKYIGTYCETQETRIKRKQVKTMKMKMAPKGVLPRYSIRNRPWFPLMIFHNLDRRVRSYLGRQLVTSISAWQHNSTSSLMQAVIGCFSRKFCTWFEGSLGYLPMKILFLRRQMRQVLRQITTNSSEWSRWATKEVHFASTQLIRKYLLLM